MNITKSQKKLLMYCAVAFVLGYLVCMHFKPKKLEMFDNADIPNIYRITTTDEDEDKKLNEVLSDCLIEHWDDDVEVGKSCNDYLIDIIDEYSKNNTGKFNLENEDGEVLDTLKNFELVRLLNSDEMCQYKVNGVRSMCDIKPCVIGSGVVCEQMCTPDEVNEGPTVVGSDSNAHCPDEPGFGGVGDKGDHRFPYWQTASRHEKEGNQCVRNRLIQYMRIGRLSALNELKAVGEPPSGCKCPEGTTFNISDDTTSYTCESS